MRKVIEVRNLYKLYRVGDEFVRALDGVDFEIYEGEFCAIVGTSGSGKSTLLNMLAGLEKPTKGEVIIAGKHIEKLRADIERDSERLKSCHHLDERSCEDRLHEDVAKHTAMYDALKIVSDMVTELEWLSNWKD